VTDQEGQPGRFGRQNYANRTGGQAGYDVPDVSIPERRLWLAVLEDALTDLGDRPTRRWIRTRNFAPMGFDWLCNLMNLEPGYYRRKVREWEAGRAKLRLRIPGRHREVVAA
jgi:hypothetical protein